MAAPKIRHITDAWLDFGEFKVCSHWAEFDAPIVEGRPQQVALMMPDGTQRPAQADVNAEGEAVPTLLRSYVGVILEHYSASQGLMQLQVRGRLRRGEGKLAVELETFPG